MLLRLALVISLFRTLRKRGHAIHRARAAETTKRNLIGFIPPFERKQPSACATKPITGITTTGLDQLLVRRMGCEAWVQAIRKSNEGWNAVRFSQKP